MKKINPVLAVCGVLIILLVTVLLYRALTAERAFKSFSETAKIRGGDIVYSSVKRPLFGDGFILYQVRIPALSVPHQIEKMVVRPLPENGVSVRMYDVRIPVFESMRQVYGDEIIPVMQQYRPYYDALRHPLVTMGVMDVDMARFNLTLRLKPSLTTQTIKGNIKLHGLGQVDFGGVLRPLPEGTKNPVFALYADLVQLSVQLREFGGLKQYRTYAVATGVAMPTGVPMLDEKQKSDTLSFTFNPPISLTPVYLRKPH